MPKTKKPSKSKDLLGFLVFCGPVRTIAHNILQIGDVAIFTTNVDAENKTLINHKCDCGALNRHFCQTRVISCLSYRSRHLLSNPIKSSK